MEDILNRCPIGSFATVTPDGAPYVVSVNYVYHNRTIYFHSALTGKKLDNIAHEPRVCFEVHEFDGVVSSNKADGFGTRYRSVIVYGKARQIVDPKLKFEVLMALTTKYADGKPFDPPTEKCVDATAVVEIEIDEMTGKKNI